MANAGTEESTRGDLPRQTPVVILLVDDQRFVGVALRRLLESESDLQLHCCEKGAQALADADRLAPALILQDLVMPDIDGLALVALYRTHASTARIPVVVLSGNDDDKTRTRALNAGASDYLVKLPSRDVLLACLRKHLSAAASRVTAAPQPWAEAPSARSGEADTDAVLDPEVIESFRDETAADPSETLRTLIEVFLTDAESLVGDLRTAVQRGDAAVPRLAHTLKGCSSAVGARRLAALCARIEADTAGALSQGVTQEIDAELERVRAACLSLR